ncbi:hypothetical protein [Streptomyces sp. NPDC052494]|uniref:hypothetical protein n=1 Tax=Streptomyces sp. NPDC052494 TaxID=3365692 RepID=UPI0037CCFA79
MTRSARYAAADGDSCARAAACPAHRFTYAGRSCSAAARRIGWPPASLPEATTASAPARSS